MITAILIPTQSAANDTTGVYYDLGDLKECAIQVAITGSDVVGTLTLEASADASTFITVANSSQAITASADHMWNVTGAGYRYIRPVWDYTSGTGNITAKITVKENVIKGA